MFDGLYPSVRYGVGQGRHSVHDGVSQGDYCLDQNEEEIGVMRSNTLLPNASPDTIQMSYPLRRYSVCIPKWSRHNVTDINHIHHRALCNLCIDSVREKAHKLRSASFSDDRYPLTTYISHIKELQTRQVVARRYWENNFNCDQRQIYRYFQTYLVDPKPVTSNIPPITWIIGCAGTGKTELIRQLIFLCDFEGKKCVRITFHQQNAICIDAKTSSSLLHFTRDDYHTYTDFGSSSSWTSFKSTMNGAALIVVDEFTIHSACELAKFSRACQNLTEQHCLPFGGIPVIMCGDVMNCNTGGCGISFLRSITEGPSGFH